MHLSAALIDLCVIMAFKARRSTEKCSLACVEGYSAVETKPLTPVLLPPLPPPARCRGMMSHPPGSMLSSCRMLLLFVCLTEWLAGWLSDWTSERVRACFCAVSKPPAPLSYPQHAASLSSQHQHTTPPTRPQPASWLCGNLATANGVLMDSPCRAANWLDKRILSNEDDGNDFTPSLPSPLLLAEYWFFLGCIDTST